MWLVPFCLLIGLIIWWALEYRVHQRNLSRIPIRIHINGTRGKSSVTRLIAWGLMGGGLRVVAKTTGSSPRFIVQGQEEVIVRRGHANIKEQISIVRKATKFRPDALVVECMAIEPELQYISEHKLIRSTLGVITNVREDHIDSMGPTLDRIADALAGTIPSNGMLFTAEHHLADRLRACALRAGSKFFEVWADSISDEEMEKFSYMEHKENVALALAVCTHLGVERERALESMWRVTPDAGALRLYCIREFDREVYLVNIFAANDPESTMLAVKRVGLQEKKEYPVVVIFNNRADRLDRTRQLIPVLAREISADSYIIIGDYTEMVKELLVKAGLSEKKVLVLSKGEPQAVYDLLLSFAHRITGVPSPVVALGLGNIGGRGMEIARFFATRGEVCSGLP